MRFLLIVLLLILVVVGGVAVLLHQFFGWKGLIAFPVILVALLWLAKLLVSRLVKGFATGLFSMKSGVLRGATLTVHSITAVAKPADPLDEETAKLEAEAEAGTSENSEADEAGEEPEEAQEPQVYYKAELTITPGAGAPERLWEPGEFILTSDRVSRLDQLEELEVGTTHDVLVWNGSEFGPDDPGKYSGEQRLQLTFAVKPGTRSAWLQYYNESLGTLDFPEESGP